MFTIALLVLFETITQRLPVIIHMDFTWKSLRTNEANVHNVDQYSTMAKIR